jgi:folylpolyglutamate synthase
MQEGVQTAIIECGIGGEYDSTNILPSSAVTTAAITSLGIDHVGMLGETIEDIAWHKAGIMKRGVPAYTVRQIPQVREVLEKRACEKGVDLTIVERLSSLENVKLGLEGDFQIDNASLAATIAASHMRTLGFAQEPPESIDRGRLPGKFVSGLESVVLAGRCQVFRDRNITWFLDGAHTGESIRAATLWFHDHLVHARSGPNPPTATMLIFNQTDRDGATLLRELMTELHTIPCPRELHFRLSPVLEYQRFCSFRYKSRIFTYAAFPTNTPFKSSSTEEMPNIKAQESLAKLYQDLDGNCLNMSCATIEEAIELAKRVCEGDERLFVFVTGSLYLVGGLLKVLQHK